MRKRPSLLKSGFDYFLDGVIEIDSPGKYLVTGLWDDFYCSSDPYEENDEDLGYDAAYAVGENIDRIMCLEID